MSTPRRNMKPSKTKDSPGAHPPVSKMVTTAIRDIQGPKGTSLPAIKKYIENNYKANVNRLNPFLHRYLKKAVKSGDLKQVTGSGAIGSFRLETPQPKAKGSPQSSKTPAKSGKPMKDTTPKQCNTWRSAVPDAPKKGSTPKDIASRWKSKIWRPICLG